jgi:ectonucleotide pyrophosphatase/phosphodiesterase family member 5
LNSKIITHLIFTSLLLTILSCTLFEDDNSDDIPPAPIILISMDGFRWDYMDRTDTPNMDYLAAEGVRAESLIPVFPSYTFPNHLSIITGCYPENHGIISNRMWDPVFEEWYYIGEGAEPVQDGRWYEAEPFWVTVERAGLKSATYHWPGSEAEIMGYRPSHYYVYDGSITNEEKIDQVLDWLDLPPDESPEFIAFWVGDANYYAHHFGVEGAAMDSVIQGLDHDVGRLLTGLEQRDILDEVNIIIVADHGMVNLDEDKVLFLDDYISMQDLERYSLGPVAMLDPIEGMLDSVYTALYGAHPDFQLYRKEETPEHLHYRNHRRIPPLVGIPDESWYVSTHYYFDNYGFNGYVAAHGYDPYISSMQAIFLASGPHFKKGITVPKFENIHIYNLLTSILELQGAPNDGDFELVRAMLVNE